MTSLIFVDKSKPKAYNFVTKLLPAKPDSEWEALLEESNGRCRVAEEHRKAEQHHAAYLIKRLADIQYLKIEDRDRGRSQRADELFQLINDNHDTRDATETVIGLVKEYWKLEKEYKNQIRAREEVATEGAISISKLEKERLDLKDDKARAASRFEQERTRLREERSRLELDNLRLRGDLDSMRKQCDSRIAETVEAHKNEMVEERRRHREAKEKIEASHKERMRELKCEHEEAILNLTEKTAQVQRTMTFDRQKIENKHVEDLQEWETRYTTKIVQMEKSAKDSQSVLERRHAAQEASLRSDITSLNKALLAREAFDPPTDHDLTAPFEDFLIDLDQLVAKASKLWQPQDLGWTDNLLARLAPQNQQKTIRRQIIQDSVWVILNKNIFCSPFRVFGEEGERLEVEWKDGYREGKTPKFPHETSPDNFARISGRERVIQVASTKYGLREMAVRHHEASP
jgi:hypothetical protein